MAPVASPTPIICVTMLGKTPLSRNGSTIVRPSSTDLRTFISASSRTALGEARHRNLAQHRTQQWHVQHELIQRVPAFRVLADLPDAEEQCNGHGKEDPPEAPDKVAQPNHNLR